MVGIVIGGPTGVGKTELSIKLAKILDAVIVNCDSMQIYKEMDIGTAKIKEEEKNGIRHYMMDIIDPIDKYSVGDYYVEVNNLLNNLEKENKNVVFVGGTGLYIDAITEGLSKLPPANSKFREKIKNIETEILYKKLLELDSEGAEGIHFNNRVKIERALEVCEITGEKFSVLNKKNIKGNNYNFLKIGLDRDRKLLYCRINERVKIMIEQGLIEEARGIYDKYKNQLENIKAIGYKELFQYFNSQITLEEAIELIQKESRHYAKRQLTWFRRDKKYKWFDLGQITQEKIIKEILENLKNI
ncbi:MAG: tRNA (adenosine(37)-N6)-dimethylallyltransferase MiaA [Fusobacteriaceae bacterium]|nr:tRNA (adenosine(37)-N6)-dimethylallyltransferase MiaA [Fusobacteriaceae bacterium]MBN2838716.1 tRNA (adenosine(37)-N6)-dimethylallyltransferase MiaA [Fusobacteriaceae bacterium]